MAIRFCAAIRPALPSRWRPSPACQGQTACEVFHSRAARRYLLTREARAVEGSRPHVCCSAILAAVASTPVRSVVVADFARRARHRSPIDSHQGSGAAHRGVEGQGLASIRACGPSSGASALLARRRRARTPRTTAARYRPRRRSLSRDLRPPRGRGSVDGRARRSAVSALCAARVPPHRGRDTGPQDRVPGHRCHRTLGASLADGVACPPGSPSPRGASSARRTVGPLTRALNDRLLLVRRGARPMAEAPASSRSARAARGIAGLRAATPRLSGRLHSIGLHFASVATTLCMLWKAPRMCCFAPFASKEAGYKSIRWKQGPLSGKCAPTPTVGRSKKKADAVTRRHWKLQARSAPWTRPSPVASGRRAMTGRRASRRCVSRMAGAGLRRRHASRGTPCTTT